MAELKTKKTEVSVESFLNAVADEKQRADAFRLVAMMKEITGLPPKITIDDALNPCLRCGLVKN